MTKRVYCLTGPTASGKSAAILQLAARLPLEVIVMDSATIYRGMDIGTAKPTPAERAAVAHHLLDIRDPSEQYSAASFAADAAALVKQIHARGRLAVLCGGTQLYFKALREGVHDLPGADAAIRAQLAHYAAQHGWPALHARLQTIDPAAAARIAAHDSQRLQRALEIYYSSGQTMSHWLAQPRRAPLADYEFITLSLEPGARAALHARIDARYRQMLASGLLEEVERLHARADLHPELPAVRCVGYRQLWDYLDGKTALPLAIEAAIAATRRLAKHQLTWLRSLPERHVIDCLAPDAAAQVLKLFTQQIF